MEIKISLLSLEEIPKTGRGKMFLVVLVLMLLTVGITLSHPTHYLIILSIGMVALALITALITGDEIEKGREAIEQKEAFVLETNNIKNALNKYHSIDTYQIKKYEGHKNRFIPKKVRKLLPGLIKTIQYYNKWFGESLIIIRAELKVFGREPESEEFVQRFANLKMGYFDPVAGYMSQILNPILKGTVGREVEEGILQLYGPYRKTEDDTDSLINFVRSEDFQRFLGLLKKIEKRPSIEEYRKGRDGCLKIIEQIEGVLKKKKIGKEGAE